MTRKRSITRRSFFQQTAGAAAAAWAGPAIVPSSALGAEGQVAPSNRITIGMIGLGRQAVARNLSIFLRWPDSQVVALCDVDRWRLDMPERPALRGYNGDSSELKRLESCRRYTDFREVLARKDVDAVMISTPDHWHVPIALAAIKAGKDVCCEKPIGLSIAHGRILADAAAKSKCVFRTDSEFRSIPHLFKAVSLVRTGKIGKLHTIRISVPVYLGSLPMQPPMPVPEELDYDMWLGPASQVPYTEKRVHQRKGYIRPGWYSNREYCDGMISNWGYHPSDIAQWGNDTERTGPVEIEGRGEFPPPEYLWNVILGFDVRYRYANGVEMFYTALKEYSTGQSYMRFEGSEGWICGWYAPDRLEAKPKSLLTAEVKPEDFPFPLKNEKRDFIDCVKTRSQPLEDAEVGHRSSSVGQLGYIACQVRQKLTWDPDTERFLNSDAANKLLTRPGREPWTL